MQTSEIEDFPADIKAKLERKKYAAAKKMCIERGIPTLPIDNIVKKEANKANGYLSNESKKYQEAMNIYVNIIGAIDPSLVLCKFFSPHLAPYLLTFLIELHKRGYAKEEHTKLLFQMFKDDQETSENHSKFEDFLGLLRAACEQEKRKEEEKNAPEGFFTKFKKAAAKEEEDDLIPFLEQFREHVGAAIDVLRKNGMNDEAFQLSNILPIPSHRISLLIESQCKYYDAAELIFNECKEKPQSGRQLLFEYGPKLLQEGKKDKDYLTVVETIVQAAVCTWEYCYDNQARDYTTLFWGHPSSYYKFLKIAQTKKACVEFTTDLIDLTIPRDNNTSLNKEMFFGAEELEIGDSKSKCIAMIKDPNLKYDTNQILFICTEVNFMEGVIALLERNNQLSAIVNYYIANCEKIISSSGDVSEVLPRFIAWLDKFLVNPEMAQSSLGGEDWVNIFQFFIRNYKELPAKYFPDGDENSKTSFIEKVLHSAETARPLTSLLAYMSKYPGIPFSIVKNDLVMFLEGNLEEDVEEHKNLLKELNGLEEEIRHLEQDNIEIRPMKCSKCMEKLEEPYVCFMCGHNLHKHCCDYGEGNVPLCPICMSATSPKCEPNDSKAPISIDPEQPDLIDQVVTLINNGFLDDK